MLLKKLLSPSALWWALWFPGSGAPGLRAEAPSPATAPLAAPVIPWQKTDPLPSRFGRFTDKNGCRWGLKNDGSIGLSGHAEERISAFDSAAVLAVDGKNFSAQSAETTSDGTRVRLRGKMGDLEVTRDIWIDPERGAARFVETIVNPTDGVKKVEIMSRTDFGDGLQSLQKFDGRPLADNQLGKEDAGVLFMQDPASKKPAVLMVLAEPHVEVRPTLSGFNNNQRWHATWSLAVAGKSSAAVVHWVVQRPNLTSEQARAIVDLFWRGNKLLRLQIDPEAAKTLVNFSPRGVGLGHEEAPGGPGADQLLGPLARFCERLGIERGAGDVYWMSTSSALSGEVRGEALTLESRFGNLTLPLAEVAAVQGAGGRGRWPRVFLRDGTVLPGRLTLPEWKVIGAKGWTINVSPETLEALVFRTAPTDGMVTPPPAALARLTSGEVLPLEMAPGEKLSLTTPWGPVETTLAQIDALWHLRQPAPACRLWLKDGSRLTVFPAPREMAAQSARLGAITLKIADLAALWRPSGELPDFDAEPEEISDLSTSEGSVCLLKGSNLIAATLDDESLTLFSGATETSVKSAEIRELKRLEGGSESSPVFHLALAGGAEFDGVLRSGTVSLRTGAGPWNVPVAHLLALKRTPP